MKISRTRLQNFHRIREAETIGGHKQNLVHTRTQEKGGVTPITDRLRLAYECLGVSERGMG